MTVEGWRRTEHQPISNHDKKILAEILKKRKEEMLSWKKATRSGCQARGDTF